MSSDPHSKRFIPGLTPRSFVASITCMMLAGIYTQGVEVLMAAGSPAEQSLPIPVLSVLIIILIMSGCLASLFRFKLLSRAETLCVFYSMLISAPMMTQGMWHRFVGIISATPRKGSFEYIDAYSDKLWPHGENLLKGRLTQDQIQFSGEQPEWTRREGLNEVTLNNNNTEKKSSVSLSMSMDGLNPGEPYLVSILAKVENANSNTNVYLRAYENNGEVYSEILSANQPHDVNYLHKDGFVRLGSYGYRPSFGLQDGLRLEFGIEGPGSVSWRDPVFYNVQALEGVFTGRNIITESEWQALDIADRKADFIIKPDQMWSLAGLLFVIEGYIPWAEWSTPLFTWGTFILLILCASFAVSIIMRRQWMDNERYSMPLSKIPAALMGLHDGQERPFAALWVNRLFWAGLLFALVWGGLKGWAFYNTNVPDTAINVNLAPFFSSPSWGDMWKTKFSVSIFLVSIAIYFELNVLLSFLVGFWLFRSQSWLGEVTDWSSIKGFPFRYEQSIGAYLGYFFTVLFFTRKYLMDVVRSAFKGDKDPHDVLSQRSALLLLMICFMGTGFWATWVGASVISILLYFTFLLSVAFVASKIRTECGLPSGYFTPYNAMIFISLLGGMSTFGAEGMMITLLCSGFLTVSVFFFIPGAQIEFIQLGRDIRLQPWHITAFTILGIAGGLFIGGWVFLSNSYGLGGDSIKYQWAYHQEWFVSTYSSVLAKATQAMQVSEQQISVTNWSNMSIYISAFITALITYLRQLFSGFWFHPVGFICGSSYMLEFCWGSVAVAWLLRSLALKFTGAKGVKNQLQPFFAGALVGSVIIITSFYVIGAFDTAAGLTLIYKELP